MARGKNQAGQRMLPCTRPAAQVCRQILVVCPGCGYKIRTTRQWIGVGLPTCCCGVRFANPWKVVRRKGASRV